MKRISATALIMLVMVLLHSCENVFHNDKLDYMWRLDNIEYIDGVDFNGNVCSKESKEGVWFSFARDLVRVEDKSSGFCVIGVLTDQGKQLSFDFSMYQDEKWGAEYGLKQIGIGSMVSSFNVTELNKKEMVLTGSKTVLRFTRW